MTLVLLYFIGLLIYHVYECAVSKAILTRDIFNCRVNSVIF
jgi:hypothetical protein